MGKCDHSGCDCRCCSAARSPRCTGCIPGIVCGPEQHWLRRYVQSELGRTRLSEDHEPGAAIALKELARMRGYEVRPEARSVRCALASVAHEQVFEDKGTADKRSCRQARCNIGARPLFEIGDNRIDRWIEASYPLQRSVEELGRR